MPTIKLPDGKNLVFNKKVTGLEVSEKIRKISRTIQATKAC